MEVFRIPQTRNLKKPNLYAVALLNDLASVAYCEQKAPTFFGKWKAEHGYSSLFVELGTGNGTHFANLAKLNPEVLVVGLELKYKPLIQSMRAAQRVLCANARMARYHALRIRELFAENEVDQLFIHFPDPWVSPRKPINRMTSLEALQRYSHIQKPGGFLEFKTDSAELFDWTLHQLQASPYQLRHVSWDWHQDPLSANHHRSQFENLFTRQGLKIHYLKMQNLK